MSTDPGSWQAVKCEIEEKLGKKKEKSEEERRKKIFQYSEQVRRSQASDRLQKILKFDVRFDEDIEERLEVLEQKVRELESR